MIADDVGFWRWLIDLLWVPFVGLFGLLWTSQNGKIDDVKAIAEAALAEKDFDKYLTDQREYRRNREQIDERIDRKLDAVHKELRDLLVVMRK